MQTSASISLETLGDPRFLRCIHYREMRNDELWHLNLVFSEFSLIPI